MKFNHSAFFISTLFLAGCATYNYESDLVSKIDHRKLVTYRYPANAIDKADCLKLFEKFTEATYQQRRTKLFRKLSKFDDVERIGVANALESMHFVDYSFTVDEIRKVMKNQVKFSNVDYPFRFNRGALVGESVYKQLDHFFKEETRKGLTWEEPAYENYVEVRKWLLSKKPPFTINTFRKVHSIMMKNGVEDVKPEELGEFKNGSWIGNEMGKGITPEQRKLIDDNIYMYFRKIRDGEEGRVKGQIVYTSVKEISDEVLKRLKAYDSKLHAEVLEAREGNAPFESPKMQELEKKLAQALTDDRIQHFNKERKKLAKLTTPAKVDKLYKLIASLQRDLVAIHPLPNGNGRTTREFAINYALIREGLPPSRILDPNMDVYAPLDDWAKMIRQGSEATVSLYEDLTQRLELNLPLENSPELFGPGIPRNAYIDARKYNSKKLYEDVRVAEVDPKQYGEFLEYYVLENPDMEMKLKENPTETFTEINKAYEEFFKRNRVDFTHKKDGLRELRLHFIERDFMAMFAQKNFRNKSDWDAKMSMWYTPQMEWRGLGYRKAMSERDILDMFTTLHSHMASNEVARNLRGVRTEKQFRRLVFRDFERYNDDLYEGVGGIVEMVTDHTESGPLYGKSYGYSTSKNRTVGKAFAMGAMQFSVKKDGKNVYVEYGMQNDKDIVDLLDQQLNGRILVGAWRAEKDIDAGRLKQLRPEFSYKYGRQQEIMGVGAADPDSIMTIQVLDKNGKVAKGYFRNPNKPNEIILVEGHEVHEFEEITPKMIKKRIRIK